MMPKAFTSLRTTNCSTKLNPRALWVEAMYKILLIKRLLHPPAGGFAMTCRCNQLIRLRYHSG